MTKLLTYKTGSEDLKDIIKMSQPSLHGFLFSFLRYRYGKKKVISKHGEYIYAKGNIPVLLLAHLDTVHRELPTEENLFYDSEKLVMWSPVGIGADDRAGVFNVYSLIEAGYRPHVLFTWDEEIGGVGAGDFVDNFPVDHPQFHKELSEEVNFAIQFDRHGFSEAVYYDLDNVEFENYISDFGYETKIGSFTDICIVCPAYGFAGVNVAAGYTDEHTTSEVLWIREMHKSYVAVEKILQDQKENPQFFEYIDGYASSYPSPYGWTPSTIYGSGSYPKPRKQCDDCFAYYGEVLWDDPTRDTCNLCSAARGSTYSILDKHSGVKTDEKEEGSSRVCAYCYNPIGPDDQFFLSQEDNAYCSRECFDNRNEPY